MNANDLSAYHSPFAKPAITIPTANFSSILTVVFLLIFAVWAIYTVVVAYHWFRYGHQSWLALPAIVAHVFISGLCIFMIASGV